MPLVPYPNVPATSGVPALTRDGPAAPVVTSRSSAQNTGAAASFSNWAILTSGFNAAIQPDSFVDMSMRNESRISSHSVEQGQFSSYNKIASPYEIVIRMTCSGQRDMNRHDFIAALERMQASTELFTIITPDYLYSNANMTGYDYRREASNGAELITVDARFEEVRTTAIVDYQGTRAASGMNQISNGFVTPEAPSSAVTSAINKSGPK